MKKIKLMLSIVIFFTLLQHTSNAAPDSTFTCNSNCCCSKNLAPTGIMFSHVHKKGEWMLAYNFMQMNMSGLVNGSSNISTNEIFKTYIAASTKMQMQMHMLMGMYGVSDRLTLMGMLNYNINSMNMQMLPTTAMNMPGMEMMGSDGSMPSMTSDGFGDAQVYALYALLKDENSELIAIGGLNLPTGSINQKGKSDDVFYPNSNLTYMMQLGSGTLDVLPGLSYKFQQNKFAFGTQLNSSIKTSFNSNHYRLGNIATINIWSAYSIFKWLNPSVRIEAASVGKITGADVSFYAFNEPAANTINYGGNTLRCFIGSSLPFQLTTDKAIKISVEYGFQAYQNYNGIQVPVKNLINATINYQF